MTGPGRVALVLAVTMGTGWATAVVLYALPWTDPIGEQSSALLSTVGGVLAGALATFLGWAARDRDPTGQEDLRSGPPPAGGLEPSGQEDLRSGPGPVDSGDDPA